MMIQMPDFIIFVFDRDSSVMKLKGTTIKTNRKQYVLKQQLGEGGFSTIYETNYPDIICKVQVLMNNQMLKAYTKEKQIMKSINHPNIVKLYDSHEQDGKDNKYGFLFMENCNNGTAFNILQKNEGGFVPERIVIKIMLVVAQVLEVLHSKGIAHRDIKMENVLLNSKGEYKLCDFGSCSKAITKKVDASNRVDIEDYIEKSTTPLYRSPQQLDLYSGYEIGLKVDIFALGVLAFMMCFQKPPFESRLSAINNQYFLPDEHNYSPELVAFIQKCFTPNPENRPSATEVKEELKQMYKAKKIQSTINMSQQFFQTLRQLSFINEGNLKKNMTVAESGLLNRIKTIFNQITTETEGWIAGFVEDNEQAPLLKYNRSIISKCYEKKYKIQKVYELLWKYQEQYKAKSLVTLKLLILLHNFLRKGPTEAITYEKDNSPIEFCSKIYKLWKTGMKTIDEEDFKRNPFVCLLIRSYSLVLIHKIKFCYENSHLIEANYSIAPYLSKIQENTILKLSFITSMLDYLNCCLEFHQNIIKVQYLPQIQKTIILSMIDEEYCLVSTLTFIISAFKMAVCYVNEDIDLATLHKKVKEVENKFQTLFKKLAALLEKAQRSGIVLENSNLKLKIDVVSYVRNIKIEKRSGEFNVTDQLNYKNSIYGLKLPLAYEQVVKNPQFLKGLEVPHHGKNVVQVNQFKVKKGANTVEKKEQKTTVQQKPKQLEVRKELSQKSETNSSQSSKIMMKKKMSPPLKPADIKQKYYENASDVPTEIQQVTQHSNSSKFQKPKHAKDKIFQNFDFDNEKKSQKKEVSPKRVENNMMEFTHQNLNQDFFSVNSVPVQHKHDQFNDFFSIVEQNFKKEKVQKHSGKEPQNIIASNTSKENFASETKPDINKIQLMNFFFDDDEPIKPEQKRELESPSKSPTPNLIQFQGKKEEISTIVNNVHHKQIPEDLILLAAPNSPGKSTTEGNQKPEEKKKGRRPVKILPGKCQDLIDLKEFVVEEVRKNAQQYIIDFSALIFKEKIGYGNSSQVFKGEWRGREVAIKKIKDNMSQSEKQFKRQIMTSVKIRHHPQLVTLIGVCQHEQYFYIINEFCNGSTLFDLFHESNEEIPWRTRINIAKQIARGMIFLHTNDPPIIHRDLKSLNVLLINKYDENNPDLTQVKIADFGLSRDYASNYMTGTLGTYHWMAPQIFNNEPYTLKADVYSYGIVLWEMATRVPPYPQMKNPHSLMKFVTMEGGRPDLSYLDKDCPYEWRMLMIRCWDKFPSNRPNFTEILACLEFLSK